MPSAQVTIDAQVTQYHPRPTFHFHVTPRRLSPPLQVAKGVSYIKLYRLGTQPCRNLAISGYGEDRQRR